MQYYLSLPEGWNANRKWPIVVTIEGSGRNWLQNAKTFADARKQMPFIIISALVLTNSGRATPSRYSYPQSVWDSMADDPVDHFRFDHEGILAVVAEVAKEYSGKQKFFITGFSGGGHTVWSMVFGMPERLAGAALAAANYAGRGVDKVSKAPEREQLPVRGFQGNEDPGLATLTAAWQTAKQVADSHGYRNVSYVMVPGTKHSPMAEQVLAFFASLPE
ncbi:MAG: hypothetical protein IMZ62_00515 [Chloroflexi bacterium]|nr:hypothetical protein [Chloroflexota bacterium]